MAIPDAFTAPKTEAYYELRKNGFLISTNPALLDLKAIHRYLSQESYWAQHIPADVVARALQNSLVFGLYENETQIGLARLITDRAVFAYICDVFVLPEFRGKGLSKWLMRGMLAHPDLQNLRKWMLATKDAHGLYAQFGFTPVAAPDRLMERSNPNAYQKKPQS